MWNIYKEEHYEEATEDNSDPGSGITEFTEETSDTNPSESISFIKFDNDVSELKQIVISGELKENVNMKQKSFSLSDCDRPESILGKKLVQIS